MNLSEKEALQLFKNLQKALRVAVKEDNKRNAELCHTGLSHWYSFYTCGLKPEINNYQEMSVNYLKMATKTIND